MIAAFACIVQRSKSCQKDIGGGKFECRRGYGPDLRSYTGVKQHVVSFTMFDPSCCFAPPLMQDEIT